MRLLWAAVILAAVAFGRAQAKVAVDQWTADYLRTERSLWQHIDVQQILVDRGNLLGEIYREHNRTLHKGIGAAATIVRLSDPAKFRPLLDAVRSIESHTVAVSEALAKGDNARVARLLKNSMAEIEQLPETVLRRIGDTAFWTEAMSNVRQSVIMHEHYATFIGRTHNCTTHCGTHACATNIVYRFWGGGFYGCVARKRPMQ